MRKVLSALLTLLLLLQALPARADDLPRFARLTDAVEYLDAQTRFCPEKIEFYLTDADSYALDDVSFPETLRDLAGQYRATTWYAGDKITVEYEYYPGTRILSAFLTHAEDGLTGDLLQAAQAARQVIDECPFTSDYDTVRYLHDWLCAHVNYKAMPEERPTLPRVCGAVGALVDGEANCQGYSDAFRLLAALAGLEVRKQSGVDGNGELHDWNVVRLNGKWYIVDTTWDDIEDGDGWHYAYMNAGRDVCDYSWDEARCVAPVSGTTDPSLWYYARESTAFSSLAEMAQAAYAARRDQGQRVFYAITRQANLDWEDLSDAVLDCVNRNDKAASWYIWCANRAGNTYYWLEWTEW